MKRKLVVCALSVMTAALLLVPGCGQSGSTGSTDTDAGSAQVDETASDAPESDDVTAYYESDEVQQKSGMDEGSICTIKEYLWLLQDNNAEYQESQTYDNGMIATYSYVGTFTKDGDVVIFTSTSGETETITVDDSGKIVSVEYSYDDSSIGEIAGTYTGESEEYGTVTLEIAADSNSAQITTADGTVITGNIYGDSGTWEFLSDNVEGDTIDWMLTLDGDTFTYQSFNNYYYGNCEGTYACTGDLGDITITVDSEGKATADVTIDGAVRNMQGDISSMTEDNSEIGFYLYDEAGYVLDIMVTTLSDGTLNYIGSYTVPLAAG